MQQFSHSVKFSQAKSGVGFIKSDVSETDSVSTIRVGMMETESVSKTWDFINLLMQLSARENLIEFCHCESFET